MIFDHVTWNNNNISGLQFSNFWLSRRHLGKKIPMKEKSQKYVSLSGARTIQQRKLKTKCEDSSPQYSAIAPSEFKKVLNSKQKNCKIDFHVQLCGIQHLLQILPVNFDQIVTVTTMLHNNSIGSSMCQCMSTYEPISENDLNRHFCEFCVPNNNPLHNLASNDAELCCGANENKIEG